MDVLLELSPGTGWLARENDRLVYLPRSESIDVAHDVIEPLLVPRTSADAFSTLATWINSDVPVPPMVLIALDSPPRAMSVDIAVVTATSATGIESDLVLSRTTTPTDIGDAEVVSLHDEDRLASGMLIEGVVRAGGFRLHLHRNPSDRTDEHEIDVPEPLGLHLLVDGYAVEVGVGVVLGRWPYTEEDLNADLEPLVVADPAVSRLHAEVLPVNGSAVVIDRQSHNGTAVVACDTGRRFSLEPGVAFPVRDGDQILLGETVVTVRSGTSVS